MFVPIGNRALPWIPGTADQRSERPRPQRTAQRPRPAGPSHHPPPRDLNEMERVTREFARLAPGSNRSTGARSTGARSTGSIADVRRRLAQQCWQTMALAPHAIHESSHLVLMVDVGARPGGGWIGFDNSAANFAVMDAQRNPRGCAVMAIAGASAEERFLVEFRGLDGVRCFPSEGDEYYIRPFGSERKALKLKAAQRVEWLWQPIVDVAKELLERDHVTGARVIELCRRYDYSFENRKLFSS